MQRSFGIAGALLLVVVLVLCDGPGAVVAGEKGKKKNKERQEVVVLLEEGGDIDAVSKEAKGKGKKAGKTKGLYRITLPDKASPAAISAQLKKLNKVVFAEPDYVVQHCEGSQSTVPATSGGFGGDGGWNLSGFSEQVPFDTIGRDAALDHSTGSGITVAVIDTGIRATHEALSGRLSSTQYDFIDGDSVPDEGANGIDEDGDGIADEATGHGTFAAGIVAGLAPDATIMPLRVLDAEGHGTSFVLADAIFFAAMAGADVINLSLGMPDTCLAVRDAVQYALDMGIVVVVAAGNEGKAGDALLSYPASMDHVIAVTSVDNDDVKAPFANFHSGVSLSAPGVGILAPWAGGDREYATWDGTSFSAPMVSAAAALLLAEDSDLTPDEVKQAILDAVDDIDEWNQDFIGTIGAGRLNLAALFD